MPTPSGCQPSPWLLPPLLIHKFKSRQLGGGLEGGACKNLWYFIGFWRGAVCRPVWGSYAARIRLVCGSYQARIRLVYASHSLQKPMYSDGFWLPRDLIIRRHTRAPAQEPSQASLKPLAGFSRVSPRPLQKHRNAVKNHQQAFLTLSAPPERPKDKSNKNHEKKTANPPTPWGPVCES